MPTIDNLPTLPRLLRSNSVKPTTPTFLSLPDIPPPTKPVVYSPVPTIQTFRGAMVLNLASTKCVFCSLVCQGEPYGKVDSISYCCLRCVIVLNAQQLPLKHPSHMRLPILDSIKSRRTDNCDDLATRCQSRCRQAEARSVSIITERSMELFVAPTYTDVCAQKHVCSSSDKNTASQLCRGCRYQQAWRSVP